jgi:hypothetical protein
MNLWVTPWGGADLDPFIQIDDHFNYGQVQLGIFGIAGGTIIEGYSDYTASANPNYVAGFFGAQFQLNDCASGKPPGTYNAYAQAIDTTSDCYSDKLYLELCYNF